MLCRPRQGVDRNSGACSGWTVDWNHNPMRQPSLSTAIVVVICTQPSLHASTASKRWRCSHTMEPFGVALHCPTRKYDISTISTLLQKGEKFNSTLPDSYWLIDYRYIWLSPAFSPAWVTECVRDYILLPLVAPHERFFSLGSPTSSRFLLNHTKHSRLIVVACTSLLRCLKRLEKPQGEKTRVEYFA